MVWDEPGTYVETDATFSHNMTHEWNHGLGEIVSAVLGAGIAADRAGRARQRAVGRPARPDGRARRRRMAAGRPPVAAAAQLYPASRPRRLSGAAPATRARLGHAPGLPWSVATGSEHVSRQILDYVIAHTSPPDAAARRT